MKIALHWMHIGQFTVSFGGRFYVLRVTPFGFKWATHTFSPLPLSIQAKAAADFRRHMLTCSELDGLSETERVLLVRIWAPIFNYCDDYMGMAPLLGALPEFLTTFIYQAGLKIMGPGCWSERKALEDGFFASVQCFIGVVFDSDNDTVRVDLYVDQASRDAEGRDKSSCVIYARVRSEDLRCPDLDCSDSPSLACLPKRLGSYDEWY